MLYFFAKLNIDWITITSVECTAGVFYDECNKNKTKKLHFPYQIEQY